MYQTHSYVHLLPIICRKLGLAFSLFKLIAIQFNAMEGRVIKGILPLPRKRTNS